MAEYIANAVQTVAINGNVLFTNTVVSGCCNIIHRAGSGVITLKGATGKCRTRFKVSFGGNIAIPAAGTTTDPAISLAIAIDGEPIASTTMITTPGAVSQYNNVASSTYIDVPACCCVSIAVENTSTQTIDVQNANLIITKE